MSAVVFVLLHPDFNLVLMELRGPHDKYFPDGLVFPGGKLHEGESAPDGCHREIEEELGVTPLELVRLTTAEDPFYYTDHPELATPAFAVEVFLVRTWHGSLPPRILDTGAHLEWRALHQAERSPAGLVQKIVPLIRAYLFSVGRLDRSPGSIPS